jgi:uncharacterized cupin superfamily protein
VEIIVTYVLPPRDRPTNPARLWRGLLVGVQPWGYHVQSIEPGYEGCQEFVHRNDVVQREAVDSYYPGWYTRYVG